MDSGSASVQRFRLNFMSYGSAARNTADVVRKLEEDNK